MIEFQNVSMAYKDRPVLNHVDLTIQDSEFFVLIGSSGCGKTTLLKSINKLLNVQKGKLLINGTPVDRSCPTWWAMSFRPAASSPI